LFSGLVRIVCCWWVFGFGAYALHGLGEGAAVVIAALGALGINRVWREQQRQDRARQHREAVIADEELRLAVRERQAKP